MISTGLPLESTYPYQGTNFGTIDSTPRTIASCSNTAGFKNINFPNNNSNPLYYRYDNITPTAVASLLNRGSLVVAIYADNAFMSYSSGVFSSSSTFDQAYAGINHAVELVGMSCDLSYYIIKNSWGTSWGQSGYAYVDVNNDAGISAFVYSILW